MNNKQLDGVVCDNCRAKSLSVEDYKGFKLCKGCFSKKTGVVKCVVCDTKTLNINNRKYCSFDCLKRVQYLKHKVKNINPYFNDEEKKLMKKLGITHDNL